jgi:hypothetical protein
MILLIGGIIVEIAAAVAFLVFIINNTNFGAKLSAEALAAAQAGIDDGIRRVTRDLTYNTTYDLTVGSRTVNVSVCRSTCIAGKTVITSTGSAFTRQRRLIAALQIDSTTGLVTVESVKEWSIYAGPESGLIAYWKFDDGSGTSAADSSGNGHTGTLYGGPTWTAGKSIGGLSFDGTDDYVNASGFTDLGTSNQPYSFSVWVKIAAGETVGNILHMSSAAGGTGWCLPPITLQSTGKIRVHSWTGALISVDSTSVLVAQQWYHVVNTWDSTNGLRVFINGSLENSVAQSTYSASGSSNYIWHAFTPSTCVGDTGSYFNGWLDEPRIYNRALSAAEVRTLYDAAR